MVPPDGPAEEAALAEAERVRRQSRVVVGLLLTFLGLALALGLLPTAEGGLGWAIPLLGTALLSVWFGGILLGAGRRPRRTRPR
ncbi:MAG TPA: hypothetical protein VIZ68_08120 [Thermoplasmata archaeon]